MKNQTDNREKASSIDTHVSGLTINEIKTIYNKLNQNLIDVMERIQDILSRYWFDENDKRYIDKRNCKFEVLTLCEAELNEHGIELISNIIEATLVDALHKSFDFFDSSEIDAWYFKFQDFKTEIIKLNGDSACLLRVINELYGSLTKLYESFNSVRLDDIAEIYDESDVDLEFEFMFVYNQLNGTSDLIEKNKILHDAIAERDMLCLMIGEDPDSYLPNIHFKDKCKNAIQIIKFQIHNTLTEKQTNNAENAVAVSEKDNSGSELEILGKNPEFTTRRQVLAMYYLLNELDKNTNLIDKTVKARFIQFLTGKNQSNIYKILSEPYKGLENEKNNKSAIKDLEYIKQHFDELGLKIISQKITNDMTQS